MSQRILLAGVGPMPGPNVERLFAPGLRLWSMTQALLKAGHHVLLADAEFGEGAGAGEAGGAGAPAGGTALAPGQATETGEVLADGIVLRRADTRWRRARIPLQVDGAAAALRILAQRFEPTALVTTTDVMALAVVRSGLPQPFYVDYNGDPMAERQMQGAIHESDAALFDAWAYMVPVLLRADHFAACSGAQRFAMLGQLGAVGRLNRHTSEHNLVDVLPPGLSYEVNLSAAGAFRLRGTVIPESAVAVLFTGGYNTWLDEKTLFQGIEEAMARNPDVHYVSTGGALEGHNTRTFDRFQRMVLASRYAERFHFLGWVALHQMADICEQSDVAVNIDRFSAEAELGHRNRLLLWMWMGMPVVTTCLSGALKEFSARRVVHEVPVGDSHALAEALLLLGESRHEREALGQRARRYVTDEFNSERLLRPLVDWASSPGLAPDRLAVLAGRVGQGSATGGDGVEFVGAPENPLAQAQESFLSSSAVVAEERRLRREAEEKLARLEGSRFVQLYKKMLNK